jgi:hypothetical protein
MKENTFDKNIPIRVVRRNRQDKFKLAGMLVGDSKFIPASECKNAPTLLVSAIANNPEGCKFSIRKLTEQEIVGTRIWRIK